MPGKGHHVILAVEHLRDRVKSGSCLGRIDTAVHAQKIIDGDSTSNIARPLPFGSFHRLIDS
jgi:hypothetical protein